jgi:hypothetical protein
MDILILGKPYETLSPRYRGTNRFGPVYIETLPEDHPANQLFDWYCSGWYEEGVVHDLAIARQLVEAQIAVNPSQPFEIVEVTTDNRPPALGGQLLGYDISAGYGYSLLETGLRELGRNAPGDDAMLRLLQPIFILLKEHFQPRLNENGLLAEYAAAKLCLDCMMALQQLRPGLWENESIVFDVVGVWLVSVEARL